MQGAADIDGMPITRAFGQQQYVSVANLPKAEEALAASVDADKNGLLDRAEQAAFLAAKTGTAAPSSFTTDDVYRAAGGKQRPDETVRGYVDTFGAGKGNFSAPGFGAGNVVTQRRVGDYDVRPYSDPARRGEPLEVLNIAFNCNLVDLGKVRDDVASATVFVARGNFRQEMGSKHAEMMAFPLDITTEKDTVWSRPARQMVDVEHKMMAASIPIETAWGLAGGSGLSFYAEVVMKDGTKHFLNRDGVSGRNFEIPRHQLETT